jgi:hypothetical protein
MIFRLLFKPWGLVVLGILIVGFAWVSITLSQQELPQRAALSQAAGVLDRATKITRGRTHSVSYDIEIKSADGFAVKLTVPERDITEEQVRSLLGRPVVALFGGTTRDAKDVWELSAGGRTIVPYEQTRQRRIELQAFEAASAPYLGGGGLAVLLTGVLWMLRRRRTAAAAGAVAGGP